MFKKSRPIWIAFPVALAVALAAILAAVGACTSLSKIKQPPTVKLEGVGMGPVADQSALLTFTVGVDNPNSVALELDSVEYQLFIEDKQVGSGDMSANLKVPAMGHASIPVPVRVKLADLMQGLLAFLQTGARHYRVKGTARLGLFHLPFERSGEVNMDALK